MVDNKDALIKRCLEKSDQAMKGVELAIKHGSIDTALNRLYYAVFHTITALSRKHDFVTKKHLKLLDWFNKKFIHEEKVFDMDLLRIYTDTMQFKQKSEYDVFYKPCIEQVVELHGRVKIFIEKVRENI